MPCVWKLNVTKSLKLGLDWFLSTITSKGTPSLLLKSFLKSSKV